MDPQRFNEPWIHIDVGTKEVCSLMSVQVHRGANWKSEDGTCTAAAAREFWPKDQQRADRAKHQTKPFLILESFTFVVACMFSGRTGMGSGRS